MPFKDEVGGNGIEIPRIQINMSNNKKDTVCECWVRLEKAAENHLFVTSTGGSSC